MDDAGLISHPKRGFWPSLKRYAAADRGHVAQDILYNPTGFTNYSAKNGEYLGYPIQKPVAILETFVKASSNKGDVVLDPFCGCGTTVHAAEKLGRQWIGIDVTHIAVQLIRRRLLDAFPDCSFEIHGVPKDLEGARALAKQDKHEFEKWAVSLLPDAELWRERKKGRDGGVDGVIFFGKPKDKAIISVEGGKHINPSMIRGLIGTLGTQRADLGVFLTLTPPTKQMISAAAAAGQYQFDGERGQPVPKVQIVTIADCLQGLSSPLRLPAPQRAGRRATAETKSHQTELEL